MPVMFTRERSPLIRCQCTFKLLPYGLKPSVKLLNASTVLFTNVTNITCSCVQRNDVVLPGCKQCIYRLPSGCTFTTSFAYIPLFLTNCGPISSNRTQHPSTHVTNLAVLSHFFSDQNLGELASDTLLRHPLTADLPDFMLLDHNSSSAIAAIHHRELELSKAVNRSTDRHITFRSMAEYMSHNRKPIMADTTDFSFIRVSDIYSSPLTIVV